MPRKLRLEYAGAIYHVMNRGDRREDIFLDDEDRCRFVHTLGEACEKTDWQVHAYCMMRNHFHLVVETPRANLVVGMQWFLSTYTARFNRRHKYFGHLFSGRYKALMVDGSGNGYLKSVCDYVHLNPARAKLLGVEQSLRAYPWSSYPEYLKAEAKRAAWLRVERLLGEWGIGADSVAGRRQFERGMEERKVQEEWGEKTFREELLGMIGEKRSEHHHGEELEESAAQKAERLLDQMLRKARWREADLAERRKGDEVKVQIAARLRTQTTMSWKWIAQRLRMGHWRSAANAVRSAR